MSKKNRHRRSLEGTGLYQHSNGTYYHRRVDPRTGKRQAVAMGRRLDVALARAAERDLELRALAAGRPTEDAWGRALAPLIERWLASKRYRNPRTAQNTRMRICRVVEALGLEITGDLKSVARIDEALRDIGDEGETRQNLRRGYQEPLKQLSAWLAQNHRVLDCDPLRDWVPIDYERNYDSRRSALPLEYARTLAALDYLAGGNGHFVSQRTLFTALLVTGARPGAITSRLVRHLDVRRSRIDLGASVGNKRRGAAALDSMSLRGISGLIAGRDAGEPLFLGPRGGTQDTARVRDLWLQANSLAIVDELWPKRAAADLSLALRVSRSLLAGSLVAGIPGNPRFVSKARRKAAPGVRQQVADLVAALEDDWGERRQGSTPASIRKTHHTWARVLGVPAPCIDKQLGHSSHASGDLEVARAVLGSRTGARHYLDMGSSLIDPMKSAQAVRGRLDEAEEEFRKLRGSLLADWSRSTRRANGGGAEARA